MESRQSYHNSIISYGNLTSILTPHSNIESSANNSRSNSSDSTTDITFFNVRKNNHITHTSELRSSNNSSVDRKIESNTTSINRSSGLRPSMNNSDSDYDSD